jgi:hypothetical protein
MSGVTRIMSADDDGEAGLRRASLRRASLRRDWVASLDTNLKASAAHSNTLPDGEKLRVSRGATLRAALIDDGQGYWTIADGVLDGVAIPAHIRLVFKAHWVLLPVPEAPEAVPVPVQEAAPAPASLRRKDRPKPPSHRRVFASFKRRLNRT